MALRPVYDLVVVGGGPAGLATAMASHRLGMRVMVADAAYPPVDKPCGEGLMPDSLAALRAIGFDVAGLECYPFRGIRFMDSGVTVEADFPRGQALGIRRALLHRRMAEQAADAGIDLWWGTAVEGLETEGVRIRGEKVPCRWIAGADGGHSRVRQWSGLDALTKEKVRFGFRRHYRVAPWSEYMELYWGQGCQVYVTPVAPDLVCVASISPDPRLRLAGALAQFPTLEARLARGRAEGPERGAVSAMRRLRHVCGPAIALVGDASGSVDAITGEGMCVAFQQARALAACFAAGTLRGYERAHRRILRRPSWMAEGLLLAGRCRRVRRIGMQALAERPALFAGMLAVHLGGMD